MGYGVIHNNKHKHYVCDEYFLPKFFEFLGSLFSLSQDLEITTNDFGTSFLKKSIIKTVQPTQTNEQ